MFRRPRFIPIRRIIRNQTPPALRRAHELMSLGRFEEAAGIFEQLAHGAQARQLPQDAQLFMIAGHCRLRVRQIDLAMIDIKQGLGIMSARGETIHCMKASQKSIEELTAAGYKQEATEIMQLFKSSPAIDLPDSQTEKNFEHRSVPTDCEACGGTLRSDEIEWIDDSTAECPWCGSTVRAE